MKVLLTGSQGFVGSYICNELLANGYEVVGVDDLSKYGELTRAHDSHPNFKLYKYRIGGDYDTLHIDVFHEKPDIIIAGAASIGGISYFHKYAYDLMANNESILIRTFKSALNGFKEGFLKRIVVISSSMVYENSDQYPTKESDLLKCPPPSSTYGFQKLACEYWAKGAWEQYGLPYTIVRPFNCIGVGEEDSIQDSEIMSGNVKLMLSHVVPDLINKALKGQNPLHILGSGNQIRCYTNGRDLARGIRLAMESEKAINEDFNISTPVATSVLELAQMVREKVNPGKSFEYVCDEPFKYDVQKRIPDVTKAKEILGFEANITLSESIDEVLEYLRK